MSKIGNFHFFIYPPWKCVFGWAFYNLSNGPEEFIWSLELWLGPLLITYCNNKNQNFGVIE